MAEFKNAVMNFIRVFLQTFSLGNITTGNITIGASAIRTTTYQIAEETLSSTLMLTGSPRSGNTNFVGASRPAGTATQAYHHYAGSVGDTTQYLDVGINGGTEAFIHVETATSEIPLVIRTASQTYQWTFGTTGTFTLPGSLTLPSGGNIIANAVTGTKIGTATSQLLGFYNATPVNQPDTVADPSGGATQDAEARTAIVAIIDRLQELGLIA